MSFQMNNIRQPINLIGGGFQHSPSTSGFEPEFITWVKNGTSAPISIYVDTSITEKTNVYTENYGWLVESKTIIPKLYDWCKNNIQYLKDNFKKVFTHDVELSEVSDVFQLTQCSAKSFLSDHEIYPKTKLVSMIASNKTMCEEHLYRQKIIKKFSSKCDHYGWGYKTINNKLEGLKDYCFSFALENATYSNMFTEKITDCFASGTVPIYHGMKNIGDFFNIDGIILLDEDFKIENLSFDLYQSKFNAIKENFEVSKNLLSAEDFIYKNFISK